MQQLLSDIFANYLSMVAAPSMYETFLYGIAGGAFSFYCLY